MEQPQLDTPSSSSKAEENTLGDLIPVEWVRKPLWIRLLLGTIGVVLVAVGMIGWLMPVIPGFVLVPFGLILIAAMSRWCARRINRLDRRLPERTRKFIHHPVHWVEARLPGDWKRKERRPLRQKRAERLARKLARKSAP
ncbi:MAG: hypothetical protein RBU21_23335 [FCB group bacterium]|jgi:hypothetical protein|nr:hypothetical protein [FCB group bacterium]